MGKYFDINGTAMVYISIDYAKTKEEADGIINNACQTLKETFQNNLQALANENPDIYDPISFEGFYQPGLDIHVFQNHAHGPSTTVNHKNVHKPTQPRMPPISIGGGIGEQRGENKRMLVTLN